MTETAALTDTTTAPEFNVETWLDENWNPDIQVGEWWALLASAALAQPTLPPPHGRGWSRARASDLAQAMALRADGSQAGRIREVHTDERSHAVAGLRRDGDR